MKLQPKHLKSFWNKKNILFVSLVLMVAIGMGVTTAWLSGYAAPTDYVFKGTFVDCDATIVVNESGTYEQTFVTNTGEVPAYVRVALIGNYREDLGNGTYGTLHYALPESALDYLVEMNAADWLLGYDSFFYYKKPILPGEQTTSLFTSFTLINNGNPPAGYTFRLEASAEAIQSIPDTQPVTNAWKVTVDENKYITGANPADQPSIQIP